MSRAFEGTGRGTAKRHQLRDVPEADVLTFTRLNGPSGPRKLFAGRLAG